MTRVTLTTGMTTMERAAIRNMGMIRNSGMAPMRTVEVAAVLNGSTMVVTAVLNGALAQPEYQVATIHALAAYKFKKYAQYFAHGH